MLQTDDKCAFRFAIDTLSNKLFFNLVINNPATL